MVEAAFKQDVARRGARSISGSGMHARQGGDGGPDQEISPEAAARADALFIPDGGDAAPDVVQALVANNINTKKIQLLGSGLWEDDQRIYATAALNGAWYVAPDPTGYRNFAARYRARFKLEPQRTATLAYDAIALIAALVKTQGAQRFSPQVLTNPSGFSGINGLFRFRANGTNERGLAVLRVTPSGGQIISPAPRSFTGSTRSQNANS